MNFSPMELIVVGLVFLVFFGTKRLPELGTGLGKAITNFKKSYREGVAIDVTPTSTTKDTSTEKSGDEKKSS